jgi:uncharacterized membrane protein
MSELIVVAFENETGAKQFEMVLKSAQERQEIKVDDAALIVRTKVGRPMLNHATNLVGRGSLGGMFWGFLLALVFWAKWWGISIGGGLGDLGVDDDFVKEVGESVGKGHSALLALMQDAMAEPVVQLAGKYNARVVRTSFSADDEEVLRVVFGSTRE